MMTSEGFEYEPVTFRHPTRPAIHVTAQKGVVQVSVEALAGVLHELGYDLERPVDD